MPTLMASPPTLSQILGPKLVPKTLYVPCMFCEPNSMLCFTKIFKGAKFGLSAIAYMVYWRKGPRKPRTLKQQSEMAPCVQQLFARVSIWLSAASLRRGRMPARWDLPLVLSMVPLS